MRIRPWLLPTLLLPTLASCTAIATLLIIPVAVTAVVFGGVASIFVSADGATEDAELFAGGLRVDERVLDLQVDGDMTFEGSLVLVTTVTSPAGLKEAQQASLSFDPRSQALELVSAKVVNPDGSVYVVGEENTFERPSVVAQGAPGFVSSTTKSILFPQLQVGSQTHVEWRFEEKGASLIGFNYTWRPSFAIPVTESTIRIAFDENVPLRFDAESPFELEEDTEGDRRVVTATLRDYEGQSPERAMVSPGDVCPRFVAATHESWEEIGAEFHHAVAERVELTPEVQELAAEIVGDREGLEAARAIHRWVCENIHYVKVYLNQMDGWTPHRASEVLANRYGDCKDKYVLTASLLAARGLRAEPVLVNLDRGFVPLALPTPLQFNHCMAYLPEFDLYSNPTDPYRDLGDLDTTLSGKFVVIASPEGRVARTPEGSADANRYRAVHRATLGSDGLFRGKSTLDFEGRASGGLRRTLALAADAAQTANHLLDAGILGGHGDLETTDPTDLDTPLHCEGVWTSDIPITMAPTVQFMLPTGIEVATPHLARSFVGSRERRYPTLISAIELTWNIELQLPEGYRLDAVPEERTVETPAGRFTSLYRGTNDGRVIVERLLRIESDRFAPEQYEDLRSILVASVADTQTILSASLRN